ncbi:DNA polymerase III subunit gamma/tau [Leptolyngbya sp. Heron Island J]|uniref:DNA polymerase III subunit gamma/tau n=1 Tax=Leptolyngbya sp. Heron Island J TaxID=1385935 RepID=UPI0003F87248|nr:DNA polymerase III subunit gamma/tau [Leptolyngbya sp. Heron Island J]
MAYEPLHHKYRPQTFAQLVGQGAIATTLSNALRQNRIAPAYLFCGPRGTGKTSSARILAKSINCLSSELPTPEPCGQCQVCREITVGASLDIVEIDAASNTGVDSIRELIERAQFAPVQCRHKLYVLDEVHMLSTAAFNALLKTLEEPPPHVVFVLATTDPQRVLPTIISRCQRFDFRRIPLDAMVQHLDYIAQQEAIAIAPDALQLVAQLSQGGLRDAESLLDQLGLLDGAITIEAVWDLVGAVSERDLLALVKAVSADDGTQVLILARQLMDRGREPLMVLQSLVAFYRDLLIAKTAGERRDLVAITPAIWSEMVAFAQGLSLPLLLTSQQHLRAAEVQVKNTTQPRLWLEITLMGLLPSALGQGVVSGVAESVTKPVVKPVVHSTVSAPVAQAPSPASSSVAQPQSAPPVVPPPAQAPPAPQTMPAEVASLEKKIEPPVDDSQSEDGHDAPVGSQTSPQLESAELPPANTAPAMGSLSDIWAKIVAQLQPFGTKVLMRQQAKLLTCDGVEATVGIRSQPLMKMAQDRLNNVEIAFEKVFGHKIRVTMVVAAAEPETVVQEAPSTAPLPAPAIPSPSPPPAQPLPQEEARDEPLKPAATAATRPASPPTVPTNGGPDVAGAPAWEGESELERSVKSFAQFFSGQIVNLDDEVSDSAKPSTEPGPDVPF